MARQWRSWPWYHLGPRLPFSAKLRLPVSPFWSFIKAAEGLKFISSSIEKWHLVPLEGILRVEEASLALRSPPMSFKRSLPISFVKPEIWGSLLRPLQRLERVREAAHCFPSPQNWRPRWHGGHCSVAMMSAWNYRNPQPGTQGICLSWTPRYTTAVRSPHKYLHQGDGGDHQEAYSRVQ